MPRQENIETVSTVTSIINASTANSDYNSTVIIAQNNQPEPIFSQLISFDISNTLQEAKHLANNQKPAITLQAAPEEVTDMIMAEANQLHKSKAIPALASYSMEYPLMEKKNMMLLTAEWRKNNPPPPKQVPKTAPVVRSRNSNMKKQPHAQNKGKGKTPPTKPYSQGYRIPNVQQDAMENSFQMAIKLIELQKK
ncbi:hypothetical protein O181_053512 [Austropuccinia psidii MF-1]|uniref:Uncharacterized protein n=1 Tax=Austropuccinia psidii MF-1 TaxID=1389203 RepID=A0A9Q3E9T1_9BASI|nr:hypothetical protein [Austropuccinia psidii MF-1]